MKRLLPLIYVIGVFSTIMFCYYSGKYFMKFIGVFKEFPGSWLLLTMLGAMLWVAVFFIIVILVKGYEELKEF